MVSSNWSESGYPSIDSNIYDRSSRDLKSERDEIYVSWNIDKLMDYFNGKFEKYLVESKKEEQEDDD